MNRLSLAAGFAFVGLVSGSIGALAALNDAPQGFIRVNSIGWGARVTRDRDPYVDGYEGYGPVDAPDYGYYGDEPPPVYHRAYRPAAPAVPHGAAPYGYDPDED